MRFAADSTAEFSENQAHSCQTGASLANTLAADYRLPGVQSYSSEPFIRSMEQSVLPTELSFLS
ncbi:MAG: hypothetical protein DCC46_00120 [Armatimonadetes bacterium]|nr:MAG: hypothetical protein DCC46_00120 [Armatimonadota bacterium]